MNIMFFFKLQNNLSNYRFEFLDYEKIMYWAVYLKVLIKQL